MGNYEDLGATLDQVTGTVVDWIWSVPLFLLLLGCGLVFAQRVYLHYGHRGLAAPVRIYLQDHQ